MPRTFLTEEKMYIDGRLIPANPDLNESFAFTTSFYDGWEEKHDKALPWYLHEVKGGKVIENGPDENGMFPEDYKEPDAPKEPSAQQGPEKALADMSKKELMELAKELRVDSYSTKDKAGLILAIESMNEQNAIISDSTTIEGTGLAVPVQSAGDVTPE